MRVGLSGGGQNYDDSDDHINHDHGTLLFKTIVFVYFYICVFVYLCNDSIPLEIRGFSPLQVYLCICMFVYLYICVFVQRFNSARDQRFQSFTGVFVCFCICIFVYLCVCVFVYLCDDSIQLEIRG